ncbi:MAG: hypothetical protein HYV35_06345 [Lentisphaerae bacterium]|nr:hypothetical protein [Lentisphaerota bacterium]
MRKYSHLVIGLLLFLRANIAWAQSPWHVAGASARFAVKIASRPSVPEAGIVAVLPDGGILPKGKFKADVVDGAGNPLSANLLWHNPHEGLALVFADSPEARAWIYISSATDYPKATAPLRPSLLLFVRNGGTPGLELSHALADAMPVGPDIYFAIVDNIAHTYSPAGRDEKASSYYLGSFHVNKAGKTFFYTLSKDGSEFFVDGKMVYSWPGVHDRAGGTRGEKGAWIDLSAGIHRIEYFHFNQAYLGRECQLGWQEAGESNPRNPNHPELPNLDVTRPMRASDFVHSGRAQLMEAASQQGPLAIAIARWQSVMQPGQNPICLFRLIAFGHENLPTNTMFEWDFGGERKLAGAEAEWLFSGLGDQKVILSVSSGGNKSICTKNFFPKSVNPHHPPQLSINNAAHRRQIRDLYLAMCRATPVGRRPSELWDATIWEGLAAALELPGDYALLSELFERARQDILSRDDGQRWLLEDVFFDALCEGDPKLTLPWLERFEKEEKDAKRLRLWKSRRVEFYLFEGDNPEKARSAANELAGAAAADPHKELALIRLGDVELHSGQKDAAQRYYAQAQELRRPPAKPSAPSAAAKPNSKPPPGTSATLPGRPVLHSPEQSRRVDGGSAPAVAKSSGDAPPAEPGVDTWKVSAVRESSFYATVRSLINQQSYFEARRVLDQWELELPLNKIAGDFPLAEAQYYLALKHFKRAQKILATYRQVVDLSNNLPTAMKLELFCLVKLNRDKEARDLAELIIKRLPNHPLSKEIHRLLTTTTGKLTVDIEGRPQDWTASEKVDAAKLAELFKQTE